MTEPHPIDPADVDALLRLNNDHASELSLLDGATFRRLASHAFFAAAYGKQAFLLAFDQDAGYDSPNFLWFRERYSSFVYVDRVVVAGSARGRGYAGRLYDTLFTAARAAGHERIVCEVNVRPPNPASDAFHASLDFLQIGEADIHGGFKSVRYLERRL